MKKKTRTLQELQTFLKSQGLSFGLLIDLWIAADPEEFKKVLEKVKVKNNV